MSTILWSGKYWERGRLARTERAAFKSCSAADPAAVRGATRSPLSAKREQSQNGQNFGTITIEIANTTIVSIVPIFTKSIKRYPPGV